MDSRSLFFGLGSLLILLIMLSLFGAIKLKPKEEEEKDEDDNVVFLSRPPYYFGGYSGLPYYGRPYRHHWRRRHHGHH